MRSQYSIRVAVILFIWAVICWLSIEFLLMAPPEISSAMPSTASKKTIVSLSTVSDEFFLEHHPREKLLAISAYTHKQRLGGADDNDLPEPIDSIRSVEKIVALRPELVVLSNIGDRENVRTLGKAGLKILDLGPPGGIDMYIEQLAVLEKLTGVRGVLRQQKARLHSLRQAKRRDAAAIYLARYNGILYGGGGTSSYHDVIDLAGLRDSAGKTKGYPQYTSEFVVAADPDFIVTETGMKKGICDQLSAARACRRDHICEISPEILNDLGRGIIESAELLRFCVDSSYEN